jgi:hypothetical protein
VKNRGSFFNNPLGKVSEARAREQMTIGYAGDSTLAIFGHGKRQMAESDSRKRVYVLGCRVNEVVFILFYGKSPELSSK